MTPSQAIVFSRMRFGLGPVTRMPPIFSDCAMVNDGLKACTVTAWGSLVGLVWSSHRRLVCHNEETCPLAGLVKVVAVAIGSALLGDGDGSDKLSKYGQGDNATQTLMLFISAREGFADQDFFNGSHSLLTCQHSNPAR